MTITTLVLEDKLNPKEIQVWMNEHSDSIIDRMLVQDVIVYIVWH